MTEEGKAVADEGMVQYAPVHNAGTHVEFRRRDASPVRSIGVEDLDSTTDLLLYAVVQMLTRIVHQQERIAAGVAVVATAASVAPGSVPSIDETLDKVMERVQRITTLPRQVVPKKG